MSESGWRTFLEADDLDDWVVVHGGAVASYAVGSLTEAGRLAAALGAIPGLAGVGALLTAGDRRLTVRLTRGVFRLETDHVALAREVSRVAGESGVTADRSDAHEVSLAIAAQPEETDVDFWRAVLGYDPLAEDNAVDPLGHGSTVWMQPLDPGRPLRHAMHVDVSVAREEAERRLARALEAGGRVAATYDDPPCWVLSDRAGNRVCLTAWPDGAAG